MACFSRITCFRNIYSCFKISKRKCYNTNNYNCYCNNRNSFKATFKENFGEENLFSLENKGYTISWEYKSNFLRKNVIKAEYKNKEKIDDKITQYAQQSEDRITYKNFDSNCELEYVVIDKGVKENIILNSKLI